MCFGFLVLSSSCLRNSFLRRQENIREKPVSNGTAAGRPTVVSEERDSSPSHEQGRFQLI